jgi:hypothetical protein
MLDHLSMTIYNFKPNLIFMSKARAYPLKCVPLASPENIIQSLAGVFVTNTLAYFGKEEKSFITLTFGLYRLTTNQPGE